MKCPICAKEMEIKSTDVSVNNTTNGTYTRIIYVCKVDDAWITVETPVSTDHR